MIDIEEIRQIVRRCLHSLNSPLKVMSRDHGLAGYLQHTNWEEDVLQLTLRGG